MILEEMLRDERAEGKAEGIAEGKVEGIAEGKVKGKAEAVLELLADLGTVPEAVQNRIMNEKDPELLKKWHRLSARANTLDEFLKEM